MFTIIKNFQINTRRILILSNDNVVGSGNTATSCVATGKPCSYRQECCSTNCVFAGTKTGKQPNKKPTKKPKSRLGPRGNTTNPKPNNSASVKKGKCNPEKEEDPAPKSKQIKKY